MTVPTPPRYETRRAAELFDELEARARSWLPRWGLDDDERDFGQALLQIAARFGSEVAERLDRAGDKMWRGFFDWLAERGEAARPARLPVVFKLTDAAANAVVAAAPVTLQASVGGASVVLETEADVRIVPGVLDAIVGVAPDADAFFLPPPGLSSLAPVDPVPVEWRLLSAAVAGSDTLQVDPGLGLAKDMLLEVGGQQYRIADDPNGNLVRIDPALDGNTLPAGTHITKVQTFTPFEGARNQQNHVLYLGDTDLLNIEAAADLEIVGGQRLGDDLVWEYWGKRKSVTATPAASGDDPAWQPLEPYTGPGPVPKHALVKTKPQGALEILKIGNASARWIRAREALAAGPGPVQSIEPISIRVNAVGAQGSAPAAAALPAVDVIVNTTPADSHDFYPLGRQPRMFDTLYIGCPEAFSKANANARIGFDLSEPVFHALSAMNAAGFGTVVAGVDKAGSLHLFLLQASGELARIGVGPHRPPSPGAALTSADLRPVMWMEGATLAVAVVAATDVWIWHEDTDTTKSTWLDSLGAPLAGAQSQARVTSLVGLFDTTLGKTVLIALRDGKVSWCDPAAPNWIAYDTQVANVPVTVTALAPTLDEASRAPSYIFLAVLDDHRLAYGATVNMPMAQVPIGSLVSPDVLPFGLWRPGALTFEIVAVAESNDQLVAWSSLPNAGATVDIEASLRPSQATSIDGHVEGANLVVYLPAGNGTTGEIISWAPFDAALQTVVFDVHGDATQAPFNGPPVLLGTWAYVGSTARNEILAADLTGTRSALPAPAALFTCAVATIDPDAALALDDVVALPTEGGFLGAVTSANPVRGRDQYAPAQFALLDAFIDRDTTDVQVVTFPKHVVPSPLHGHKVNPNSFALDPADHFTQKDDYLLLDDGSAQGFLVQVTADVVAGVATIAPAFGVAGPVQYWRAASSSTGWIYPAQRFDATNNTWDVNALRYGDFYYPDPAAGSPRPRRQHVIALAQDGAAPSHAQWVALESRWSTVPAAATTFVVDAVVRQWRAVFRDTTSNPTLAWEYWNGTGWWRLNVTDATHELKNSGEVKFIVPADLKATDWAGKTSHWVRARLIGGDYGQERVVVTTKQLPSPPNPVGSTEQVVTRSTEGIQPPYAIAMWVRYAVDTAVVPTYLQTADSGSLRDQSAANRTPGAVVEIFTPLATTLQRLSDGPAAARTSTACPPSCDCASGEPGDLPGTLAHATTSGNATTPTAAPGRALFLGFTTPLSKAPVTLLLLVDRERKLDTLAPLQIDALVGDHFTPVVVSDTTRALGESGLLTMSFTIGPVATELFGKTLSWLRLMPSNAAAETPWDPGLRGAYVNAAWASARETLTRELVGSSEGAPNLVLRLARPPLVQGSLELRVREPLSDQDIEDVTRLGYDVDSKVVDLPGDWVLWKQVPDPLDEDAGARVFALDEALGTVRFGDGLHGMIPPVGRDCIVAFRYQRTEALADENAPVPGNLITERTPLNLVSPVESVESVIAADQAAGGAGPEPSDRVLRFGAARMRHRERAITAADLEDIALESSVEIAQARCLLRPDLVRLVVAMRGNDPLPKAADVRELRSLLLRSAPAALAASGALSVEAPALRTLRVDLTLVVASLAHVGRLGDAVTTAIAALFDPAKGGRDGSGWPLGAAPREDDIARALDGTALLEGIDAIAFREIAADGTERDLATPLKSNELIVLGDERVRLTFDIVEPAT